MSITLRPEHEKAVAQAVESGAYANADQVIERALEVLRAEDGWLEEHKDRIAAKIGRAFDQFDRVEFYSAEESRSEMEKRKAEWLGNNSR